MDDCFHSFPARSCPNKFSCSIYRPVLAGPNVLLDPVVILSGETATSIEVCES